MRNDDGGRGPAPASRFARDRAGVTAVEFGFVGVPLIALMIATLQIALTFFSQQALETATEKGARRLLTGQVQRAAMKPADFKASVCANLPGYMTCDAVMIDVNVASNGSFSGATTNMPTITFGSDGKPSNAWAFNTGRPGDIVVMRAMYMSAVMAGPLGFDLSNLSGSRRLLMATSVFRAENY